MTQATMKRRTVSQSGVFRTGEFHSLLVPIDLTPGSDRVLGRVALLPLGENARVTILHVVPGGLSLSERRRAERDAGKALANEVRYLRDLVPRKISISPVVKVGAAAKEIAGLATKLRPELIVMGRGGGRILRDAFVGSTAERVIRQTQCPVLVVRLAARAAYSRPALALDLDEAAQEVIGLLLRVCPPPRPRVDVIHAFDVPYHGLVYPSLSEEEVDVRKSELRFKATQELVKLLATAMAKAGVRAEDWLPWKTHVLYGAPRGVVEKAVKKAEADLLALGTHAYSGASYLFLGTVAGDLLRSTQCDVLLVPPRARRK